VAWVGRAEECTRQRSAATCCPGRKYIKPIYISPEEVDRGAFAQGAEAMQADGDGAEHVWISDEAKAKEEEMVLSVFRKLEGND
jgi:hypothetical protein